MKNPLQLSPKDTINAFLLFFVIHSSQVGVGIHGFQRFVYHDAKHDAWISVLLIGIVSHIIVIFMIKTLEMYDSNDLYGIHQDVFGKWIGNFLNGIYILYCSTAFFAVLRNYMEVINAWVFPNLNPWFLSATLLLIVMYAFLSGLRVIVGIAFFSVVFSFWLYPLLIFPLEFSSSSSFYPILESDIISILKGAQSMTFTIIGFEILNVIYPFVKDKENVKKHVHLGLLATTVIYLAIILVSLAYYSEGELARTIWATLTLFSIVRFPFIERFEFIAINFWMLIIIPNLCLYIWAAYRGTIRLVKISAKKFVWIFSIIIFIFTIVIQTRTQINMINTQFGKVAFYIVFVYPIFLYVVAALKKKLTSQKEQKE
ncbi:GerAB/ArcD/ProY family transporter [Paenisporosarcina indica]|uniref:GerAB/ArcD/ProY family transporter n=1 Tax=Paenisporosarcina indica TaxID=650093 RepID=UPI00094FD3AE|nr:GerAB/ArcD/ProY family transporter [Paenisporosarcina indica]